MHQNICQVSLEELNKLERSWNKEMQTVSSLFGEIQNRMNEITETLNRWISNGNHGHKKTFNNEMKRSNPMIENIRDFISEKQEILPQIMKNEATGNH